MHDEGSIILFNFPQTDQEIGKLRPALIIRKLPGKFNDSLICMISSQLHHYQPGFDEVIHPEDDDYIHSGLKLVSVIRLSRLAVVEKSLFMGKLGDINSHRLQRLKINLSQWIDGKTK